MYGKCAFNDKVTSRLSALDQIRLGKVRRSLSESKEISLPCDSDNLGVFRSPCVWVINSSFHQPRSTFLHRLWPFDYMVDFHRYIGAWALVWTVVHVIGHAINFYHISTQTPSDLACLFRDYFRRSVQYCNIFISCN